MEVISPPITATDIGLRKLESAAPQPSADVLPDLELLGQVAMGNVEYFLLFVETTKADLLAFAPAAAQKNINLEILSSLLIPVPPLNELTRIVTRVASLRRLCADLRLAASQSTQTHLTEALVAMQ